MNNMQFIGRGLMGFSNSQSRFPNAATIYDDPAIHRGDPRHSSIYQILTEPPGARGDSSALLRSWVVDIIPYLETSELYNCWNEQENYLADNSSQSFPSNAEYSRMSFGFFRCPNDETAVDGKGNLSYAVNGGFTRWPAVPISWTGSPDEGRSFNGQPLRWLGEGGDWTKDQAIGKKLGVMFLGTHTGDQPWDIKTTPADISDGASHTLLLGENTHVGYSDGTSPYAGMRETNWACPLPNFAVFLGSDDVCQSNGSPVDCLGGQLAPTPDGKDGPGWAKSSAVGTFENIGFGRSLNLEGSFPFVSSGHPDGSNFVFCDGSVKYIKDTIDGRVYSRLITPAGGSLPATLWQSYGGGRDEE